MYRESYGACGGYGRFRGRHQGYFGRQFSGMPVNIEEKNDSFQLLLFAPALDKNLIKISAKDDVLTISYKASEEDEVGSKKFTRREYHNSSFERSFLLNGKVAVNKISANYIDGILTILLPKDPERNKPEQKIEVD